MADESFILVSLKENKAKKLAQVISNDTSRKILDFLASKKDATESDIAKELKVPISTVHYNLKHLLKARLVQVDEFHYSKKGREMDHYKLANKFVIIAPGEANIDSIKDKLKTILPVAMICAAGAGFIQWMTNSSLFVKDQLLATSDTMMRATPMAAKMGEGIVEEAVPRAMVASADAASELVGAAVETFSEEATEVVMDEAVHEAANIVQTTANVCPECTLPFWELVSRNATFWFIVGAVAAILAYFLVSFIRKKLQK